MADKEKIAKLQSALCDVRRAHRLIYVYQKRMLDLVHLIGSKLDFNELSGDKYFSDSIIKQRNGLLRIFPDMWAWDYLYSYVFGYDLGENDVCGNDCIVDLCIVQYSDTGYYDSEADSRLDVESFTSEEESSSKLLFVIEKKKKNADYLWNNEAIVNKKEYSSKTHTKSVLRKKGHVLGLYSFPIERFIDENSMIEALNEFIDFCKENDICELKLN